MENVIMLELFVRKSCLIGQVCIVHEIFIYMKHFRESRRKIQSKNLD